MAELTVFRYDLSPMVPLQTDYKIENHNLQRGKDISIKITTVKKTTGKDQPERFYDPKIFGNLDYYE